MEARQLESINQELLDIRLEQHDADEHGSQGISAAISLRNQRDSRLLSIPAELRNKIYAFLFISSPILVCFVTSHATRPIDPCPFALSKRRRWSHMHYPRHLLSLTEACRQTYTETRLLPFSLNTFVGYPEELLSAFPGRFYRAQLDCITTIHLKVQTRDVTGLGERYAGTRKGQLSKSLCDTLDVLAALLGLRTLRVVWDGEDIPDDVWERIEEDLVRKVAAGFRDVSRVDEVEAETSMTRA